MKVGVKGYPRLYAIDIGWALAALIPVQGGRSSGICWRPAPIASNSPYFANRDTPAAAVGGAILVATTEPFVIRRYSINQPQPLTIWIVVSTLPAPTPAITTTLFRHHNN